MAWRSNVWSCRGFGVRSNVNFLTSKLRGHRFTFYTEQRCGFKKAPKKNEPQKVEPEEVGRREMESAGRSKGPSPMAEPVPTAPPRSFGRLLKPLVFTVAFTGCSFGTAAIWQYESLKSRVQSYFDEERADWLEKLRPQKEGDIRKQVNRWWNSLSEGQRTVTGIIAANVLVFCLWRVPSMQRTMMRYFTSNPAAKDLCFPMIFSTFSHYSLLHMAANMYVLWSFSSSAVSLLGREQFMAVYLSAGVISTFASYICKTASGRLGPSLGASGAIMTILAAVCMKMPEAKLAVIFLPMFTFTAGSALKAIVAMDAAGLVLGWRLFDHAAHLGGALFGIWYITHGHEMIWKNREPLVKIWHDMRTKGPGTGGNGAP
ncbi:hypothetical protein AOXY_G9533 [Acipenser oxyrinchus oxyrinchus]|uniref:rhomboid protease n=1 Tax=Acipenser oxyrinchus oxyrinchus TaxID=40147 RepID=A0AAD8G864_ACIOX|nr:hypothetical protein AOXY_G9533 [Acipenser oxyrinchus oxyrinchus]